MYAQVSVHPGELLGRPSERHQVAEATQALQPVRGEPLRQKLRLRLSEAERNGELGRHCTSYTNGYTYAESGRSIRTGAFQPGPRVEDMMRWTERGTMFVREVVG